MIIHQELKLIKERRSKSTGLLSRIYQYRNFEIEVETDTLGALPAECRIKNNRIQELSISVCPGQKPVLSFFPSFITSQVEDVEVLSEELKNAAKLMGMIDSII